MALGETETGLSGGGVVTRDLKSRHFLGPSEGTGRSQPLRDFQDLCEPLLPAYAMHLCRGDALLTRPVSTGPQAGMTATRVPGPGHEGCPSASAVLLGGGTLAGSLQPLSGSESPPLNRGIWNVAAPVLVLHP